MQTKICITKITSRLMTIPSGTFRRAFLTCDEIGMINSMPMNRKNASPNMENTSLGLDESTASCSTTCPVPSFNVPAMPRKISEPIRA